MRIEVREIPQPKRVFVLTLSEEEARAIKDLCGRVSGEPLGPRGLTEDICYELGRHGVPFNYEDLYFSGGLVGADRWPTGKEVGA